MGAASRRRTTSTLLWLVTWSVTGGAQPPPPTAGNGASVAASPTTPPSPGVAGPAGDTVPAAAPAGSAALTFDAAWRLALAVSPDLVASQHALAAARAGVDVAREHPNPELLLEKTKETPTEAATLSLPIETGGKRRRRVALAQASLALAEAEAARAAMDLRVAVRRAFFTLAGLQRQAAERAAQAALAQRIRDTAQARFEAGDVPRLDVVQSGLVAAQALSDADAATAAVVAARATMNVLLSRPADGPLIVADELSGATLPPKPALVAIAARSSVELARLQRQIEEQSARLALARAQRLPDVVVAGAVTHNSPPDFVWGWRSALTIPLPIFTTHRAGIAVEEATLLQRQAERDAARRRLEGEVARTLALATAGQRAARRYRDEILPQTEEVERMAEDSYRSGQTGLVALLQALQAARDTRAKALQALIDYQSGLADLEQAMGAPLP